MSVSHSVGSGMLDTVQWSLDERPLSGEWVLNIPLGSQVCPLGR